MRAKRAAQRPGRRPTASAWGDGRQVAWVAVVGELCTIEDLYDAVMEVTEQRSLAAKLYNAELHFVVPKWSKNGATDTALKRRLARLELTPSRVWAV